MGCGQSNEPVSVATLPSYQEKWATTTATRNGFIRHGEIDQPPPEFREELSKPYQDVLDGRLPNMTKAGAGGAIADHGELDALLREYKECDQRIRSIEKEDPLILYYVKQSHLKSIEETVVKHTEMMTTLEKRVREEIEASSDTPTQRKEQSLRSAVLKVGDASKLPKAEQDMIAKRNQLEIATTELEMLFQEKALLESDILELKKTCAKLTKDYRRQEEIASQLSSDSPAGGELELLGELANVETRRIKISEVYERWKEARVQVADSCTQFSSALQKWREMKEDSADKQYEVAEEVRDELITALQFLFNARFYVQNEFPYCTKQEINILNKALTYIFVDMRTEERRKHADSCYAAFHNRAVALYAWIDTTVKAIIQPAVLQTAEDLKGVVDELQELRFQSIKHQFPNVTWHQNNNDPVGEARKERAGSLASSGEQLSDDVSTELLRLLDLSQLAPLPRTVDIFGKPAEDLVESYKITLRESLEQDIKVTLLDELVKKRKESLAKKGFTDEDTVGLA